ncbi:MAG TPA: hypothetical protein VNJ07_14785 [Chitinophagales bacterium]|nr:hypothetical protein [Chitinophagales bacterium]
MQNELRSYIKSKGERAEKLIARGEIAGLVLCLTGVFMMMQKFQHHNSVMIAGLSLLAFVYAFYGNFLAEIFEIRQKGVLIFSLRVSYLALAVTTIGILFRLQHWPAGSAMLFIGCGLTGAFFLFLVYKLYIGRVEEAQIRMLISNLIVRMLPALLIVVFLIISAIRA